MSNSMNSVSVVVPLFNEEDSAPVLYQKIVDALTGVDCEYEIIFVDDGSSDRTFEVARHLARSDPNLRIVKFRRNFGQTPAMAAGIEEARNDIVITMDGDLQNDPADIPKFLEKINAGNDIVVGWRFNRQDKLITRKIPSRIANWLIGKVTGVPIKDNGCSLKAYRSDVIKNVQLYSEMHRFIPAMANVSGARIKEIKVNHHARQFGESKYGLSRVYKVLIDLAGISAIRSVLNAPARWFALFSLPFGLIGLGLMLASALEPATAADEFSVVFAGAGMAYLALSASLFLAGPLVELLVVTSDIRARDLISNTARVSR